MAISFHPLLGIVMPSLEMLLIFFFAGSLPLMFFLWIKWWLAPKKEESPEQTIAAQEAADALHRENQGHQGGEHGHGHGHDHQHPHHRAHA